MKYVLKVHGKYKLMQGFQIFLDTKVKFISQFDFACALSSILVPASAETELK